VKAPRIVTCLLALEGPEGLERALEALLPQTLAGDAVLVALAGTLPGRPECAGRVRRLVSTLHPEGRVRLLEEDGGTAHGGRPFRGAEDRVLAFNDMLIQAEQEVVAFLDDRTEPAPGWLEGVRAAMADPGIDLVAGRILAASPAEVGRPGGRLRWTGHIQSDYTGDAPGTTSLAHPSNFAEDGARWPFAELEFFVRLGKEGGRGRFAPEAAVAWRGQHDPCEAEGDGEAPSRPVARTTAMAAVFARHEAWALLIMGASHLLGALPEVFAGRLPRNTPGRLVRAFLDGIRLGVRSVQSPIPRGKGSKR
jgi:hypothetical protein